MVLTQEEIEDIKAECFANDVSYDYERLKDWDDDTVREWFEAGGDAGSSADAPAFMIAMRAMNADLVARLQEMQPEETHVVANAVQPSEEPLRAVQLDGLVHVWFNLAAHLKTAGCRRFILQAAVRSIASAGKIAGETALAQHFRILLAVALSSEPAVNIALGTAWGDVLRLGDRPTADAEQASSRLPMGGTQAVLLLGFGGSSLASLAAFERIYERRYPTWLRIIHAGPLLLEADSRHDLKPPDLLDGVVLPESAAALDRCLAAVQECERLLVHVQSNQGHMVWSHLLRRHPQMLRARVRGVVYDCAAAEQPFFTPSMGPDIQTKSVLATLKGFGVGLPPGTSTAIEAGAVAEGAAAERSVEQAAKVLSMLAAPPEVFAFQRETEPPVPALCLTSEIDSVIKADGVREFARRLTQAQPARSVRVEVLRGEHVMQVYVDTAKYEAAIVALVADAGMGET